MKIGKAGSALIKEIEDLRLVAYPDKKKNGVWTIGWGHTKGVKPGMVISEAEAEELFREDVAWVEKSINDSVKVPLNQNQFDALASLVFNIGETAFETSTLLKVLNRSRYDLVPSQMVRWCYDDGIYVPGLETRRHKEVRLWNEA